MDVDQERGQPAVLGNCLQLQPDRLQVEPIFQDRHQTQNAQRVRGHNPHPDFRRTRHTTPATGTPTASFP
jgi:hypothetical protein